MASVYFWTYIDVSGVFPGDTKTSIMEQYLTMVLVWQIVQVTWVHLVMVFWVNELLSHKGKMLPHLVPLSSLH